MNFNDLIQRYSTVFELVPKIEGQYVAGEYVAEDGEPIQIKGAIVKIPIKKVYGSGGYYNAKDLRLFMLNAISHKNASVRYKGNLYHVEDTTDYSEFVGCHAYILKWVSVFDGSADNG